MPISDALEKLGRAIFETPFNAARLAAGVPELAEIRLAALEAIKAKSHRVGGARVFPYNRICIHLRGIPESQAEVLQDSFLTGYLKQELMKALARSSYRFPEEFDLEVKPITQLPGLGEDWILIETESRPTPARDTSQARKMARLVVVQGVATPAEVPLNKARINIGRTVDVFRSDGPSRRNDLAFTEENEINRSVSREHAHILFQKKSGEYRLFNDRWHKPGDAAETNPGLWIVRDGLSQPVHRNARGALLKHGDEIHLGRAVVRFAQK